MKSDKNEIDSLNDAIVMIEASNIWRWTEDRLKRCCEALLVAFKDRDKALEDRVNH